MGLLLVLLFVRVHVCEGGRERERVCVHEREREGRVGGFAPAQLLRLSLGKEKEGAVQRRKSIHGLRFSASSGRKSPLLSGIR